MKLCSRVENVKEKERILISLLDLPEVILEDIFERLSPTDLCSMARVCFSLWEMCTSDHLWEKQLKQEWGKLIRDAAYREWKFHVASIRYRAMFNIHNRKKRKGLFESLCNARPLSWIRPKGETSSKAIRTTLPVDSIKALYLSLKSGKFRFPAQIYYGNVSLPQLVLLLAIILCYFFLLVRNSLKFVVFLIADWL